MMKEVIHWCLTHLIKLYQFLRKNPKVFYIVILVIVWHVAAFQFFGIKLPNMSKVVAAPKPIAIQTVKLNPPKPKPPPPKPPKPKEAPPKKKDPKPEKKPEPPKPKEEKKPKPPPPPKPPEKPKLSHETKELLEDLSDTLKQITDRNEQELNLPKVQTVTPLSEPVEQAPAEISFEFNAADPADLWYREELVKRLKLYLKLPEIDNVQVRLTIFKNGSVSGIKIMESKSEKNEQYVLQTIPKIPFPKFGSQMSKHEYRIFPLILESEG